MAAARVVVFASGTGANLETCLSLAGRRPDLLRPTALVTDNPRCRAVGIARAAGLPCLVSDFASEVGRASDCADDAARSAYAERARVFHDRICQRLIDLEERDGPVQAIVFAYRRWVHGELLKRYQGRILNQHPGDLTRLDDRGGRTLVGNDPVLAALRLGLPAVRTTTFLVDDGHDTGSIVAQGPWTPTAGHPATRQGADSLERLQKRRSDPPALICALMLMLSTGIARGARRHPDGSPEVLVDGVALPAGGIDTARLLAGDNQGLPATLMSPITEQIRAYQRVLAQRPAASGP